MAGLFYPSPKREIFGSSKDGNIKFDKNGLSSAKG